MNRYRGIQHVRLRALHEVPYFSSILTRLQFYEAEDVPTVGIDKHGRVYVNVSYFESLTLLEQVGVVVHELRHLLHKHFLRGENLGISPELLNIAGDVEINDSDHMRRMLPDGVLYPESFGWPRGLIFEEYVELAKKLPKSGGGKGGDCPTPPGGQGKPGVGRGNCGSGADGKKRDYELPAPKEGEGGLDETDLEICKRQIAEAVKNHVAQNGRGSVPGNLIDWSEKTLAPPKVHWTSKLRSAGRNAAAWAKGRGDYTYSRRSRFQPKGAKFVIPAGVVPVPEILNMIDTSGSMSSTVLQTVLSEARECLRISAGSVGKVCVVDAQVHSLKTVSDVRNIELAGRGGTDLRVGFQAIADSRSKPDIIVVFTDGYTPWPDHPIRDTKTIVALCGDYRARPESVPSWATVIDIPND